MSPIPSSGPQAAAIRFSFIPAVLSDFAVDAAFDVVVVDDEEEVSVVVVGYNAAVLMNLLPLALG